MRFLRILLMVLYASYLTNVGLLLVLLPWSEVWVRLVLLSPAKIATLLDSPAFRGALSAFGILHFILLAAEIVAADAALRKNT
ncbi:MAG: hypothetical protein V2I67_11805 [Thermoanaerobaculales bacterium]|nr:hypothetical protein [Thermoanaerobaculales bacterium]